MKLDIGELKLLREYQREARSNNLKYFFAINALYEFFKNSSLHYRVIKSLCIAALNQSSYIKNKLVDIALVRSLASKFDFFDWPLETQLKLSYYCISIIRIVGESSQMRSAEGAITARKRSGKGTAI